MPKRVVTGQHEDGTSYFARVDELEEDFRGIGSFRLWAVDDLAGLSVPLLGQGAPLRSAPSPDETVEALRRSIPQPGAPGEFRIHLHDMAPPAGGEWVPFMHWHNTFDLQWLMAGELTIRLDDGNEVTMRPGDVVVQHGTNHAWRTGPDGAVLAIFMFGGERVGVAPPAEHELDRSKWGDRTAELPAGRDRAWHWTPVAELLARTPQRIVTGQTPDGTSRFARTEPAEMDTRSVTAGAEHGVIVHRIWANDQLLPIRLPYLDAAAPLASAPSASDTAQALRSSSPHAGPGGLRVSLIKFLPHEGGRAFGLHWHDTVDVQWLFAGELTIGLDDGSEVTLQPGDAVIQHGTNHSWRTGPEGAVVGLVMLGVERRGVEPPAETRMDQTPAGVAAREAAGSV